MGCLSRSRSWTGDPLWVLPALPTSILPPSPQLGVPLTNQVKILREKPTPKPVPVAFSQDSPSHFLPPHTGAWEHGELLQTIMDPPARCQEALQPVCISQACSHLYKASAQLAASTRKTKTSCRPGKGTVQNSSPAHSSTSTVSHLEKVWKYPLLWFTFAFIYAPGKGTFWNHC